MGILIDMEEIDVDLLTVDFDIQRALNTNRIKGMVENFNDMALGVISVSRRTDGTNVIVDGQHRWAAARQYGLKTVQCKVYRGLSKSDEAALFRWLNNTKVVSSLDRFRVRVVEGDPIAVDIKLILDATGWQIPAKPTFAKPGNVGSPVSLEWVYTGSGIRNTDQPYILRQTIECVTAAWGYDPDGMRADIIKGVGVFLSRFDGKLDLARVVRVLASYEGGPMRLQADAAMMRNMRSAPVADSVAEILTTRYNRKRTVHRLPDWFTSPQRRVTIEPEEGEEPENG